MRSDPDKPSARYNNGAVTATSHRCRLKHDSQLLELAARRGRGLRTRVELFIDRHRVGEASGVGRVLAPLPAATPAAAGSALGEADAGLSDQTEEESSRPMVLVRSTLPGTVSQALLLVPRLASTDHDAIRTGRTRRRLTMRRCPHRQRGQRDWPDWSPRKGILSTRLRDHSRTDYWPSNATIRGCTPAAMCCARSAGSRRGCSVLQWIHLPELAVPAWLQVIIGTAKFWLPVLIAIGVALAEIRRRRAAAAREGNRDAQR
jgi:hypothetical protein